MRMMIQTIEEAIKDCEEVAEKNEEECKNWTYGASQINDDENRKKQFQKHAEWWHERAKEHRQLAEWLRQLKDIRHLFNITEKLFKANFRGGLIDVVDSNDILFSEHKQLREIFEEVANASDTM